MKHIILTLAAVGIPFSAFSQQSPATPQDSIKPIWEANPEQMFETGSTQGKKTDGSPLRWTKDGDIVYEVMTEGVLSGLALVEGNSGKVIDQFGFEKSREGYVEFKSSDMFLPDSRLVVASVTYRALKEKTDQKQGAMVHLRVFDLSSKKLKLIVHKQMAFDSGLPATESGIVGWSGQVCVQTHFVLNRLAVLTPYYLLEFDATSWKPFHGTRMKGGSLNQTLLEKGVVWDVQNKNYFMSDYGGDIHEVSKQEADEAIKKSQLPFNGYMKTADNFAATQTGSVKIQLDGAGAPKLNLAANLPAPASRVYGYTTTDKGLLTVQCERGKKLHCVILLPGKGGQNQAP